MGIPEYRKKCFEHKGRECEICGSTSFVVAHHIDGDRKNDELSNLMPVCRSCHLMIHSEETDSLEKWTNKLHHESRQRATIAISTELYEEMSSDKDPRLSWNVYMTQLFDEIIEARKNKHAAIAANGAERIAELTAEKIIQKQDGE